MFISKTRDIVIPQIEHARLSGAIAYAWGNADFDRPALPFNEFIAAITLHDRGYDSDDNDGIGEMSSERWLEIQRQSAIEQSDNKVVELVILFQLRRISTYSKSVEKDKFIEELDERIAQLLKEQSFPKDAYMFADRITQFADNISFDFCHESETSGFVDISPKRGSSEELSLHYQIGSNGIVYLNPWPLNTNELNGYLIGFERNNYPKKKAPLCVNYKIRPKP